MKKLLFTTSLLLATLSNLATASQIVGKLEYSLPAGNTIWVPPFVAEDTFSGRVTETIYNETLDETFISLNTTSLPLLPNHYLEIGEGAEAGRVLDIVAATGNSVTIAGDAGDLGLLLNQRVIVREHLTLEALLPDGADMVPFVDSVSIFTSDGARLDSVWNPIAGIWIDGLGNFSGDQEINPGQGVLFFLSQELTITLGGNGDFTHVKTTPTRFMAHADAINLVGPVNPFPGTRPLSDIGFLDDLTPFQDSASFFTNDGSFIPTDTYLSEGGFTTGGTLTFVNGLGADSSAVPVAKREATVVNVLQDKTIGLAAPIIAAITP